jgi:glucosamine--fructose-6-phosphate aminotransferase (isomerizing)
MVEQEKWMSRLPMFDNILAQPDSHRALLQFHEGEGEAALQACAEVIRNAPGRIIVTGMGASYFAALPAVNRLARQGHLVQAIESSELLHYGAATLRAGDVGVLISRSGGSVEVLRLAEKMRAVGMTLIGITNVPDTSLEAAADLTLLIGSLADQLVAVQTYTGTVLALLLLAEEVISGESSSLNHACVSSLPLLAAHIEESFRASEDWRDLLIGSGALYLLGRGPALASVGEGALLLHETAKAAAVGMSAGQFRHGPVEAVSPDFRAVVFGTPAVTRTLDRSLADDLFRMGAKVRWIGPAQEHSLAGASAEHAPLLLPWPEVAPLLAPIFDIVPLQVAAYQLALWTGITPGDFRYASEVTAAESGFPLFQSKLAGV